LPPRIDCHLHTARFSCDAEAALDEYVARGRALGFDALCTTEHMDFDPADACFGYHDPIAHRAARAHVRAAPPPGIEVLIGIEIDYQARFDGAVRQFLAGAAYDLVIGSVHYVPQGFVLHTAYYGDSEREDYMPYFEALLGAAETGLFDVIGHLDIVKRYGVQRHGPFSYRRYAEPIDAVLRACIANGTGLEINTSGLRGLPQEPFPALPVLRRYRELGGQIVTVGSDAHRAHDFGRDIAAAVDLARTAGFDALALFENRQPRMLPIE
jgi:histidinol-phosphatase (PHP family)